MIEITIYFTSDSGIGSFEIRGHADTDESGKDIVCAGISAVVGMTLLGLEDIVGIKTGIEQREGYIYYCLPSNIAPRDEIQAQLLLKSMILGINKISRRYPGRIMLRHEKIPILTECTDFENNRNNYLQGGDLMPEKAIADEMKMESKPEEKHSNPYSFEKVFGVALLGALSAVLIYYTYNQLSDETKKVVKETIVSQVKSQVAKFGAQ